MAELDDMLSQIKGGDDRYEIAARELVKSGGKNKKRALLKAGFTPSQASHGAREIMSRPAFLEKLKEVGGLYTNKDLGAIGRGKLLEILQNPELEYRTAIQASRMALEVGGEIGQNAIALHLHEAEQHLPPHIAQMLAQTIMDLKKQEAITVEATNAELPQNSAS